MYFPVMRGKQFELIALRELASVVPPNKLKPVIEPVRGNLLPLVKTIESLNEFNIVPIIIINPTLGDFFGNQINIYEELRTLKIHFIPCIKVDENTINPDRLINSIVSEKAVYVVDGLTTESIKFLTDANYCLINRFSPEAAIRGLTNIVLMDDPFPKKNRNADYSEESFFSDLHASFQNRNNVIGFGDYTIVGNDYSESGGPAYVVTIHLSYIKEEAFDSMYIKHFSSEDDQSPTNPGGKFKQALDQLVQYIEQNNREFFSSLGLKELINLHVQQHFPGLGVIKKLSIEHHIHTMCNYLDNN